MTEIVRASLALSLPFPPTLGSYYRPIVVECKPSAGTRWKPYIAKLVRTQVAKLYRDNVIMVVRQKLGRFVHEPIYRTAVRMDLELRAPDRRHRDIDNHLKALQDSLQHANVLSDDCWIQEATQRWGKQSRPGQANIIITALDQPAEPNPQESILDSTTPDADPEEDTDPFDVKE